jgi:hypothetical protein
MDGRALGRDASLLKYVKTILYTSMLATCWFGWGSWVTALSIVCQYSGVRTRILRSDLHTSFLDLRLTYRLPIQFFISHDIASKLRPGVN